MNYGFRFLRRLFPAAIFLTMLYSPVFSAAPAWAADVPPLSPSSISPLNAPNSEASGGDLQEAARAYAAGDLKKARELWENLAKNGDAEAMNNLGVLYDQGQGVERDAGRALHWFAEAANAGNASGMTNYARLLEQGRGIEANPEEAARWLDQAARLDQPEAQFNLGYLYEHGRGVPRDDAAAAAWYSRAASLRQPDAMGRLGHFYRVGKVVPQDEKKAILLLYGAAMGGSAEAISELQAMHKEKPAKAQATLFGQQLDAATRPDMRAALKKMNTKIRQENDKHICDVYEAGATVPGAGEMAMCYGPEGRLAFLKIDYPAPDKARADAVLKMVESRFGEPSAGEGEDSRLWNLGSIIVATQYAPAHKLMSLMYMAPEVYRHTQMP